jgi:hypothetical protein
MLEVPIGSQMRFRVHMLKNAGSTKPSDPFSMRIMDEESYLITEITDERDLLNNFRMSADTPAEIYIIQVSLEEKLALKPTMVKFFFYNTHALPAGAVIDVFWPP